MTPLVDIYNIRLQTFNNTLWMNTKILTLTIQMQFMICGVTSTDMKNTGIPDVFDEADMDEFVGSLDDWD